MGNRSMMVWYFMVWYFSLSLGNAVVLGIISRFHCDRAVGASLA
jgi:hypothetical protein